MLKTVGFVDGFPFLCDFLAANWLSDVHAYADENQFTTSASKCDSPVLTIRELCAHGAADEVLWFNKRVFIGGFE